MLLDQQMPMKSGVKVVLEVKKFYSLMQEKLILPKFVVVTDSVNESLKHRVQEIGVELCYEKPLSA